MTRRFSFVYQQAPEQIVTGGHLFEAKMVRELAAMPDTEVETLSAPAAATTPLLKLLAPLRNLSLLPRLLRPGKQPSDARTRCIASLQADKPSNTIIFNSSKFLYLLPLVAALRLATTPLIAATLRRAGINIPDTRTIAVHHHFLSNEYHGLRRLLTSPLERLFLRLCNDVIAPSPYMLQEIPRLTGRTPIYIPTPCPSPKIKTKSYNSYNSYNSNNSDPSTSSTSSPSKKSPLPPVLQSKTIPLCVPSAPLREVTPSLLFTGTIEPRKGLHHAIDALAILHARGIPFHYHIVGKTISPAYREQLDSAIIRHGLQHKITFHGFLPRETLDRLYSEADIYLFPSLQEGFGLAIAEAMAWGLPTVAFRNSAIPLLVRDGITGLLADNADPASLAAALTRLLPDPVRHPEPGTRNPETILSHLSAGALAASAYLPHHSDFLAALRSL